MRGGVGAKMRSGKIRRGTIKTIADGEPWTMRATTDDLAILDEIGGLMKESGVGVRRNCCKRSVRSLELL